MIRLRIGKWRGGEVMAIPGSPLDPRSQGCNHLIREGATLVRGAGDILEGLGPEGTNIDEVIRWCGMPASTVLATIHELEIAGQLTLHHGNRICLVIIR